MNTKQCVAFAFLYSTSSNQCAYVVYNLKVRNLATKEGSIWWSDYEI
jgi:hypothetical protein